jgi:hypothetical protein
LDGELVIRAMVQWQGGHFYVFARSRNNVSSTGTFKMSLSGRRGRFTARRGRQSAGLGRGGSSSDSFADGNAIYLYRIDRGITCGLRTGTAQPAPGPGGPTRPEDPSSRRTASVGRLPTRVSLRSDRLVVSVTCKAACTVRSRLTMRGASRRIRLASRQPRFVARTQQPIVTRR